MTPRGGLEALVAGIAGLAAGVLLHTVAIYLRDRGPAFDSISFRGNGALIVLPAAVVVALVGMAAFARRGIWPAVILVPLGVFLGLFVVFGSF